MFHFKSTLVALTLAATFCVPSAHAARDPHDNAAANQRDRHSERVFVEAATALRFAFDFAMLAGLQQQAEEARLYIAGMGGRYNRAAYDAALQFLMFYEDLIDYLAVVDIDPWAGTNADADGHGDTGLDSSDAGPAAAS